MSVLQCVSVAMKATMRDLEKGQSSHWSRLHALRQEQMMETLECLLQMGSYLHTMVNTRLATSFYDIQIDFKQSCHAINSFILSIVTQENRIPAGSLII